MSFKINSNNYISILLSIFTLLIFSLNQLNLEDLWFDELMTLWITNPEFTNLNTYKNIIAHENTPPLYYFIIKFFFIVFGYDYEVLRIPNLIFHLFSIIFFFKILKKISSDSVFIYLAMMLFSLNSFLISYVQEGRVFIFFCLTSLCFVDSYLYILKERNNIRILTYFIFFLFSFILLNTFIFSIILVGSVFFYELFYKKKDKVYFIVNIVLIISIILSIIINIEFYKSIIEFKATSISKPNIDFYIFNYFFKQFFGSKIMGYLFIIFFIFSTFLLFKKKNITETLLFLLIIIFFSYLIPIIYGYFFSPVLQDKYIIYIIPIIIIFISLGISKINNTKTKIICFFLLLIISIGNQSLKNFKKEIDKPQFVRIVKEIENQPGNKNYVANFMDNKNIFFNNLVENYIHQIIEKKDFKFNKKASNEDVFWIICYDPSNTYDYCLIQNELINNYSKKIKFYQTVAVLKN